MCIHPASHTEQTGTYTHSHADTSAPQQLATHPPKWVSQALLRPHGIPGVIFALELVVPPVVNSQLCSGIWPRLKANSIPGSQTTY